MDVKRSFGGFYRKSKLKLDTSIKKCYYAINNNEKEEI